MPKLVGAGRPYESLVANLRGGSDPSRGINPEKMRIRFRQQHIREIPWSGPGADEEVVDKAVDPIDGPGATAYVGLLTNTTPGVHVAAQAEIIVADNDFTAAATVIIGEFELVSGDHFVVGGTTDLTAQSLTDAINSLPGFSASVVASTITVTGPNGVAGNVKRFEALYTGAIVNFTLDPTTGFFGGGEPVIGPPEII